MSFENDDANQEWSREEHDCLSNEILASVRGPTLASRSRAIHRGRTCDAVDHRSDVPRRSLKLESALQRVLDGKQLVRSPCRTAHIELECAWWDKAFRILITMITSEVGYGICELVVACVTGWIGVLSRVFSKKVAEDKTR